MGATTDRVRRSAHRHGVGGAARLAAARAGALACLHEQHLWYELDLGSGRPCRELPAGLRLLRGGPAELGLLERDLPSIPAREAVGRLEDGAQWWLVADDERLAFSCWIFHGRAPVLAAPRGVLSLPDGVAFLEDSVTSPAFRGRSVAPAAWSSIADGLAAAGERTLLTKVALDNEAVQRALAKIGFARAATVDLVRVGVRTRVRVEAGPTPGGRVAAAIAR